MIDRVEFKNYKSLVDFSLNLGRLTVLVGPNACGKSSVLTGLDLMSKVLRHKGPDTGYLVRLLTNAKSSSAKDDEIGVSVSIKSNGIAYSFGLGFTQKSAWTFAVLSKGTGVYSNVNVNADLGQVGLSTGDSLKAVNDRLGLSQSFLTAKLLKLDADILAQASFIYEVLPEVSTKGFGLPSALAQMATADPLGWKELQESLSAVIPSVKQVRTVRERVYIDPAQALSDGEEISLLTSEQLKPRLADVLLIDHKHAIGVPASKASSGTLLTIAILAVLHSQNRPKLILIDELDHGLHPAAMGELVKQIKKILDTHPDVQIVATTHSPYLVDCLEPEEVRLLRLLDDGQTAVASLIDHPDFQRWKETMMPGEFWSHVGEKWITGATRRGQ